MSRTILQRSIVRVAAGVAIAAVIAALPRSAAAQGPIRKQAPVVSAQADALCGGSGWSYDVIVCAGADGLFYVTATSCYDPNTGRRWYQTA